MRVRRTQVVRVRHIRSERRAARREELVQEAVPVRRPVWLIDKRALEASVVRDSFYDFVQRFWGEVVPEKPVWNWHIKYLCDELQAVAERVFRGEAKEHDLVINVPPASSKSTVASIMFPIWVWTQMPTARSICTSYAHDLALDLSRRSRNIIRSEKWKALFPHVTLSDDQDAKGYFLNNHGGFRYSVGTDGSVTGFHAHFIIIDDPVKPARTVHETEINTANRFISETLGMRKVDKEISVTILIMQRLHQNDPTAFFLAKSKKGGTKVKHIKLPAQILVDGLKEIRPRKLFKHYRRGLLDPIRGSEKAITAAKADLISEFAIAGQLYQNPVPLSGGMFKVDKLHIEKAPSLHPTNWKRLVRYWDKAGTQAIEGKRNRACFTVGVLMGEDRQSRYWILDVIRGQWESGAREQRIQLAAQTDGVKIKIGIEQEPGSGGKESAENTLRKTLRGFRAESHRPTGDKEDRADPYSVQVNVGNVYLNEALWNRDYVEELQYFPASTFKDQVDASSGAFYMLTKHRHKIGVW